MDTVQTMLKQIAGPRGEQSIVLYQLTEQVVRQLHPKDYLGEILAVRNFVASHVRYKNDPLGMETVSDPQRLAEEILRHGKAVGDCDDQAAMICAMGRQCGREAELVVVGFGQPGHYSHVFARLKEPKSGSWIVCDPVAGINEGRMLRRVRTWRAFPVD